jgi:hypothetical protein
MLIRLKDNYNLEMKLTIIWIRIISLSILLKTIYEFYLSSSDEKSLFSLELFLYNYEIFYFIFPLLVAIMILFYSKLARISLLVFSYLLLMYKLFLLAHLYSENTNLPLFEWKSTLVQTLFALMSIYTFSNKEALSLYDIKEPQGEFYAMLSLSIGFLLLLMYVK